MASRALLSRDGERFRSAARDGGGLRRGRQPTHLDGSAGQAALAGAPSRAVSGTGRALLVSRTLRVGDAITVLALPAAAVLAPALALLAMARAVPGHGAALAGSLS